MLLKRARAGGRTPEGFAVGRAATAGHGWSLLLVLLLALWAGMAFSATCQAQDDLRLPETDAGVFDPIKGPVRISYRLLKDVQEVEILVVDFRGQVAERMSYVELRAGDRSFEWRGLDDNGEPLPDGRYRFEMRAVFTDGHTEENAVEVRIAVMPEKRVMPPPEPLPPEEPFYRIDGSISTFWRRNEEDPDRVDEDGEQRVWTRLLLKGEHERAEGVFSMRRPYSRTASYEGSRAMAEKSWDQGRIKGVFRQSLGNLDDPMKLFSDFRTDRKKAGARFDHDFGRVDVSLLGFAAEGNVDSRERGGAFRVGLDGPCDVRMGLTLTGQKALPGGEGTREGSRAGAADLAIPIDDGTEVQAEVVATRNAAGARDRGWVVAVEHDSGNLRASAGYYDLGEDFSAAFADPMRRVQSDAHGIVMSMDLVRPKPVWVFRSLACSARGFTLKRESSGETLQEGDASLRLRLAERDSVLLRWLGREEGETRSSTFMASGRHAWSDTWSSTLQVNTTRTRTSETWRGLLDAAFRKKDLQFRMAVERVRRVIETSPDSPYEETGLRMDGRIHPFRAYVSVRRNRRGDDSAVNCFGRFAYEPEILHRYRLSAYVALGNRSAFETEKQVELGMELRF